MSIKHTFDSLRQLAATLRQFAADLRQSAAIRSEVALRRKTPENCHKFGLMSQWPNISFFEVPSKIIRIHNLDKVIILVMSIHGSYYVARVGPYW